MSAWASQEISWIRLVLRIQYRFSKSPLLVPDLSNIVVVVVVVIAIYFAIAFIIYQNQGLKLQA